MTMIRVRDRFPETFVVELDASAIPYDPVATARIALHGLFTLAAGLFEPLTVEVILACCDAPTGAVLDEPDQQYRQIELENAGANLKLRSGRVGSRITIAPSLNTETVAHWLEDQLRFDCDHPDRVPGWSDLLVDAVRAPLPPGVVEAGQDFIPLILGHGILNYPVSHDGERYWISGPLTEHAYAPPLRSTISQEAGFLTMSITLGWTLWSDADGAAFPNVQRSLDRLGAEGWMATDDLDH